MGVTHARHHVMRRAFCAAEHGYDQAISPKILSRPSAKDFSCIFVFLMRQLDPSFSIAAGAKLDNVVPQVFKSLKCGGGWRGARGMLCTNGRVRRAGTPSRSPRRM
jgi:hypothetical protein